MGGLGIEVLAAIAVVLLLGGTVKGAMGVGLPLIAVPGMAMLVDVPTAVAVMIVPIVVSNLWQALHLGWPGALLRRFWPLILTMIAALWWASGFVATADARLLSGILGAMVILFAGLELASVRIRVPPGGERPAGLIVGALSGITGGLSTVFAPPLILFLVALDLRKDAFVQAIGTLFFVGSAPLLAFYGLHGVLNGDNVWLSALACVPVLGGLAAGQRLRDRIPQERFRRLLLVLLLLIGANLLRRALV